MREGQNCRRSRDLHPPGRSRPQGRKAPQPPESTAAPPGCGGPPLTPIQSALAITVCVDGKELQVSDFKEQECKETMVSEAVSEYVTRMSYDRKTHVRVKPRGQYL